MVQRQIAHRDVEGAIVKRQLRRVAANERDARVAGMTFARQSHERFIAVETGNGEGLAVPVRRCCNGLRDIRHARANVEKAARLEVAQRETNDGGSAEAPVDQRDIPEAFLQFAGESTGPSISSSAVERVAMFNTKREVSRA